MYILYGSRRELPYRTLTSNFASLTSSKFLGAVIGAGRAAEVFEVVVVVVVLSGKKHGGIP